MGIRHFFSWFKNRFATNIHYLRKNQTFQGIDSIGNVAIDTFMIDMNGLFHTSAQKIYEYGTFKPRARLLGTRNKSYQSGGLQKQLALFEDICNNIDAVVQVVKPAKRLILCVDGPAPLSKQNQQRQRRFMSAMEKENDEFRTFDSNSITPGTKLMHFLTGYIDWYIRKQMSTKNTIWSNIEVIFSNEKVPGEGEHKLLNYIRKYGSSDDSYCVYGMDADLIMLSLGTHLPKIYILREEPMSSNFEYYLINVGNIRKELVEIMKWQVEVPVLNETELAESTSAPFDPTCATNDFIFMCFLVGNDFLPHMPAIEIIEKGIESMIDVYKNSCQTYGHLTKNRSSGVRICRKSLAAFLGTLSQYEQGIFENKLLNKDKYFPDPVLERNAQLQEGKYHVRIEDYRKDYYQHHLPHVNDLQKLCHDYLEGMQWVLTYYTQGVPNWRWRYPYHYAPFAFTLSEHVKTFSFKEHPATTSTVPFIQLISVLPPESAHLLPVPLNDLLTSKKSPLHKYCPNPTEIHIDLAGKRQKWEATVILPMVDYAKVEKCYFEKIQQVSEQDRKRNIVGKSFVYTPSDSSFEFRSYYGNFTCHVVSKFIEL